MVRAPRPDIVPPGWQLQLIDVLAHGDGGVEPAARACGGAPHEGQNDRLYITYSILTTLSMSLASSETSVVVMYVMLYFASTELSSATTVGLLTLEIVVRFRSRGSKLSVELRYTV